MKQAVALVSVPLILFCGTATANCGAGSKTIFSCLTSSAKRIEVCDSRKTIDYTFGKPNDRPEIAIRAPRSDTSTYQWAGFGRGRTYSVSVPNGNTTYTVFYSWDSMNPNADPESGVEVEVDKKVVATVKCSRKSKITHDLEGVDLKPSER